MRTAILTALLLTTIHCGTAVTAEPAGITTWGNEQETLTILSNGAHFEGLCLQGAAAEKIVIENDGTFSARGTLRHTGGARRDDAEEERVIYRGRIEGDAMTLTIERMDHTEILESRLKKGARGNAHPCAWKNRRTWASPHQRSPMAAEPSTAWTSCFASLPYDRFALFIGTDGVSAPSSFKV